MNSASERTAGLGSLFLRLSNNKINLLTMGYLVASEAKEALEMTNQNTAFTFFFSPPLSLPAAVLT